MIKFSGVAAGQACTVVLRGATTQMIDEAERSLHDALSVLSQTVKESRVVLGGGCSEMLMSNAVEEESRKISGKKAIATEAFSKALRQVSRRRYPVFKTEAQRADSIFVLTPAPYDSRRQRRLRLGGPRLQAPRRPLRGSLRRRARHEPRRDWVDAQTGCHRVVQAQAAGRVECERGGRDDP